MSNLILPDVTDYASAEKFLGTAQHKRLAYKTTIYRTSAGIGVSHHSTMIIEYLPEQVIRLNSGGWSSSTTANRMHRLTPSWLRVRRRQWTLQVSTDHGTTWRDLIDRIVYAPVTRVEV